MWRGSADELSFDQSRADALVGKYVLVGITYLGEANKPQELKQLHGVIESVTKEEGIKIRLRGSSEREYLSLPPDLDTLRPAPPGEYRLKASGEVVVNPDYTTQWTLKRKNK